MVPAIFLDRDGVLNENRANYVQVWEDVALFPQALQAVAAISKLPYKIFVVTNQSAVGRGIITLEQAQSINNQIHAEIIRHGGRIDRFYLCPHAPQEECDCRKPKPGMLRQAEVEFGVDLSQSVMIGDALTDIAAGQNAGTAKQILLLTGRGKSQLQPPRAVDLKQFAIYNDLLSAVIAELL